MPGLPPWHSCFRLRSAQVIAATAPGPKDAAIGFILTLGRALHRYGTPAHRLEDGLRTCCDQLGLEAELFTTPTTIIMSFGRPTELRTRMLRVSGGELDMGKLALVDALADKVSSHQLSPADGVIELERIQASPPQFGRIASTLAGGCRDRVARGVLRWWPRGRVRRRRRSAC